VHDLQVRVIHANTGELLRDLILDPTRDYQPRGVKCGNSRDCPNNGGSDLGLTRRA
jgi:hypothetical protein